TPLGPAGGEAWITTFDVGQGLAVLVRTANHSVLYDAGPAYGTESDSGSRVVVPALRGQGVAHLDLVVLSHEDSDHIGGATTMLAGARVLRSDVLLVPHHGSRSSSTAEFVAAVAPRWAVVPVGYRSRFGHPNPEVLARYRAADVQVLRTDLQGAITLRMGESLELQAERQLRGRYWLQ